MILDGNCSDTRARVSDCGRRAAHWHARTHPFRLVANRGEDLLAVVDPFLLVAACRPGPSMSLRRRLCRRHHGDAVCRPGRRPSMGVFAPPAAPMSPHL